MSSPNDPGYPRAGDGPANGNGSSDGGSTGGPARSGPSGEGGGEVPPWQRGGVRSRQGQRTAEGPQPEGGRVGSAAGHAPGVDARLNRFVSGGPATPPPSGRDAATTREVTPPREGDASRGDRTDQPRPETARPDQARTDQARTDQPRPDTARPEQTRSESYASELPDLSGGAPRSGPRKPPSSDQAARPATRVHMANRPQGPVRASMQIRRFDPWSVLKVSLVLSVALFFVWMIAVAFLYLVLGGMGVWTKLNSNVGDLLTSASGSGGELVSSGTIFGGAALVGLMNIILLTAMATCGAFIYNLTTDLVGGIEVTLADRD
ncbi:DUF3566 domain-containing protein [Mycolicibacterium sediminis]|uniref:DUF3566 domain-containing protein n=1 Tax=Mycolicibacterium sediminis TaxID=1286180 RepID=A0A7I7QMJ3_9MYCO|nr:DUF3566 domain-containing protein [Mycolicibacterium sediminis]BBY27207.1 hypothetical protein MSEDJ_13030 [Mycolicibacterium sediminis]